MRSWTAAAGLLVLVCQHAAWASNIRPLVQISGPSVRLSDLFSGLAPGQDCVLGDSPAPGARLVIGQPQLEAIASQFGVDWAAPPGGSQTVTLDRPGRVVDESTASALIDGALARQVPGRLSLTLSGYEPMTIDRDAEVAVDGLVVEAASGEVRAMLTVSLAGHLTQEQPVSGRVDRILSLPTPIRPIMAGDMIDPEDLAPRDFPASRVAGHVLIDEADAAGLVSTRYLAPGQPIARGDLKEPDLVSRGGAVRIDLAASGIELTAQGVALEAGAMDDRVRVLNPTSRAILLAWVTGRNTVRVDAASSPFGVGQVGQLASANLPGADRFERGSGP